MNYIGVNNPEIAKERVRISVSKGGHGIPDKDIERRYYDSLDSLKEDIKLCDEINICDNTEMFREIIDFQNSKIVWIDNKIPTWAIKLLEK